MFTIAAICLSLALLRHLKDSGPEPQQDVIPDTEDNDLSPIVVGRTERTVISQRGCYSSLQPINSQQ